VTLDELLQVRRHLGQLQIAAPPYLVGDILRDVARPALSGVEAHDPRGVLSMRNGKYIRSLAPYGTHLPRHHLQQRRAAGDRHLACVITGEA